MATSGITVLKNNVPWGPFTREQIDDGLARGDFTVKYLAHTSGLREWLPLGEVIDYVDRNVAPRFGSLPPVPEQRELPPVPAPVSSAPVTAPPKPPILPAPVPTIPERPVAIEKPEPIAKPEVHLPPATFFPRGIAFLIDCAILFVPLGILYIVWALAIEIPAAFHHIPHQQRMDEWDLLKLNINRLFWLDAIGFGWIYGAGLESSTSQATIGKRWMGIKIADVHGERLGFLRATGRYAAKYLSALPCFLGFIMALFNSRNLTLHDWISDTRAVRK